MKKPSNHNKKRKQDYESSSCKLTYDRFRPAKEGLREALCTIGNGYFATRGAAPESSASRIHYPGTYIAGVYNKLPTHISGRTIYNEDMVNCPNWLLLNFRIGKGDWVDLEDCKILAYMQELDTCSGVLSRKIKLRDRKGNITTIQSKAFASMANHHIAAIQYTITPENYSGLITVRSALDGTVINSGVARYKQLNSKHLRPLSQGKFNKNGIYLGVKTSQSKVKIYMASKVSISVRTKKLETAPNIISRDKKEILQDFEFNVQRKAPYVIEKIVSIYTSKDKEIKNHNDAAVKSVKKNGFNAALKEHKKAWDSLWRKFDIKIQGDEFSQKVIRLHCFHLLQTASFHTVKIDAGFPARGLHGEAYRGHIFWDELFAMPFYDLHAPKISEALLLYRYRRLDQARKYAASNGFKGSMFPWQSSATGEEETQVMHLNPISGKWGPDYSCIQRHVSFAIAYNTWEHWERTKDLNFLIKYGVELLTSIARFGASLSKFSQKDKRYHTEGLMGPDEFHEKYPGTTKPGFKDNAYTNLLIVWTLKKAQEALDNLPQKVKSKFLKKFQISQKELNDWKDITKRMKIIINDKGIISQFDGYFKLKELNWAAYKLKYGNIQRLDRILKAEGKSPNNYKVAKQADVLMLFYLLPASEIRVLLYNLGYKTDRSILEKNYNYYLKRTSHGSTLSRVVHCYLSERLGKMREAWDWYNDVIKSDIYDVQGGTTPEGIHTGVMGGSIHIAIQAFAGISVGKNKIYIMPRLPKKWLSIKFHIFHMGTWISFTITKQDVIILVKGPKTKIVPTLFQIYKKPYKLKYGRKYSVNRKTKKLKLL